MTDYSVLKRLAEAATPGPWYQHGGIMQVLSHDCETVCETFEDDGECPDAQFIAAANPAAVLALIADLDEARNGMKYSCAIRLKKEIERLESEAVYSAAGFDAAREEIARLKAEVAGLRTGYEAYEQVNAELKAEVEALRDDLEQSQYDANAWRNGEESVWIEVFNSEGDDPFISAVTGQITIEQLTMIQAQIAEYREDYFEKGAGLYVFRCAHYQAHYDNVGMTEPAHWETDFESYSPFEWAEEAEAVGQAVQP